MKIFDRFTLMSEVAKQMKRKAAQLPTYSGTMTENNMWLIEMCKAFHQKTGTVLIFTRDAGHHSSGWWKNPDYERCWHLSLSFWTPVTYKPRDKDVKLTEEWIEAFFHEDKKYIWSEPPYSESGIKDDVWHYRVFCDPSWRPIIPKGEVYSKTFTEKGWLSFSDLKSAHAEMLKKLHPLPGEQ